MTPQEKALLKAKKTYGTTAFTEDTINYRRVGYKKSNKVMSAIGNTWSEAFNNLKGLVIQL